MRSNKRQHSTPDRQQYVNARSTASARYKIYAHIVWSTKYRRKIIGERLTRLLNSEFQAICDRNGYSLLSVAIAVDHVHILISLKPEHAISAVVQNLKGASSHAAFTKYPELRTQIGKHLWSKGYSVETLGDKNVAQIKAYLDKQEDNHFWDLWVFSNEADGTILESEENGLKTESVD
ncbi:IS200/IS605 family transposase [Candidatus Poribacteria bacterium]|nr:IS200/IS605 family transposase [Candidatus Poribacteria bacterium]